MGRIAAGVRAIQLEEGDEVVAMELAEKDEELLVVTQAGYGKRTPVKDYKNTGQRRQRDCSLTTRRSLKKTGELIGAMAVNENDEIMLINSDGIIIRIKAEDVSRLGRATQGVRIMKVAEDANIIAMAKVVNEEKTVQSKMKQYMTAIQMRNRRVSTFDMKMAGYKKWR